MREINNSAVNNFSFNGKVEKPQDVATPKTEDVKAEEKQSETDLKKLSQMPGAALGQSQVSADNIESDMKALEKNPSEVNLLNAAFENYIAKGHTYEEAIQLMETQKKEFAAKK